MNKFGGTISDANVCFCSKMNMSPPSSSFLINYSGYCTGLWVELYCAALTCFANARKYDLHCLTSALILEIAIHLNHIKMNINKTEFSICFEFDLSISGNGIMR